MSHFDHLETLTDQPRRAVPKPAKSRVDERLEKVSKREANWRAVCQQVDRRDNYACRACGSRCNPEAVDPLGKGHRHHITFRSKGGQHVTSNAITLCSRCHDAVHVKRTLRIDPTTEYGADGPVCFWRTDERGEFLSRRETGVRQVEQD